MPEGSCKKKEVTKAQGRQSRKGLPMSQEEPTSEPPKKEGESDGVL
jgi:hypothetical protein